jgi:cyclic beta-1,2-glucan glucanotransferase
MPDNFILQGHSAVSVPAVPPSSPPLDEEEQEHFEAGTIGEERLAHEAWREANRWKLGTRRRRCRRLETAWRNASESIEAALRQSRAPSSEPDSPFDSLQSLSDNARLLRSALQTTRHAVESARDLPQLEAEGRKGGALPRAYVASLGFLQATAYAFEEHALEAYFKAFQEWGAFGTDELWAVKPLMQLVLLVEIAGAANRLSGDSAYAGARAEEMSQGLDIPLSNLISGLRELVDADWKELLERLSQTEQVLNGDPSGVYPRMDPSSRDVYRKIIRELAACSEAAEPEIARKVVAFARQAQNEWNSEPRVAERRGHVGYYLVDKGRPLLESQIRYRPPFSKQIERVIRQVPEAFYIVGIELLTVAIIAFILNGLGTAVPLRWALLLLLIPATESAVGVMNQLISFLLPPRPLPKLDFSRGIPKDCATVVVVPTLLISEQQVRQAVRDLEVRYAGNRDANLHFALLTDLPDSLEPSDERDILVELCSQLVTALDEKYRGQAGGCFFHFHRHRIYNASEGLWMGWERKRGKLLDFNNYLRGKYDSFPVKIGDLSVLRGIRYVITLDADTQLPRESAHRLAGALAHPLNRAVISPATNTVVEGYGILQPRVGISVRSANRSRLANIYSGQSSFDLYSTGAVSNTYQDLTGEGSFTGKGIYEVDVFQQVLSERFPLNAILSHDLIEGAYARAGFVSDVEVIDDYPSHFRAFSRRKHRWVRGDWQIMRWLLPRVPGHSGKMVRNPISVISRWKILDNLRRSVVEIATFVLLIAGWLFLPGGPSHWTGAVLGLLLIPAYLRLVLSLSTVPRVENLSGFLGETAEAFIADQVNVFMMLAFLAYQVLVTLDAIVRTVVRLTITRRRLLEWETAAESEIETGKKTLVDLYLQWAPIVALVVTILLSAMQPRALAVALPFILLWACSGALARWLSRPLRSGRSQVSGKDEELLRQVALATWRYFRSFSNDRTNGLIPDNFQEFPPVLAERVSPTNLGLLLNARVAAYELGYLTLSEFVAETDKSLATAHRLPKYNGHLFNWYDTASLQPLEPRFVSTVDSGNLACCLWTLKQACLRAAERPPLGPGLWQGIKDHVNLIVELAGEIANEPGIASAAAELNECLSQMGADVMPAGEPVRLKAALACLAGQLGNITGSPGENLRQWIEETGVRLASLRHASETLAPCLSPEYRRLLEHPEFGLPDSAQGLALSALPAFFRVLEMRLGAICDDNSVEEGLKATARSVVAQLPGCIQEADRLRESLLRLGAQADALVAEMDFRFLYNPRRKVMSIGYSAGREHIEKSCYDLLASEARTAAFVAIAKGDAPQESWFQLARPLTLCKGRRTLLSWSGTMFEYLMPPLWMKVHPSTVFDQCLRAVVRCQRNVWKKRRDLPWGISESACSDRDEAGRYQYHAFGIPVLALQPRMRRGRVITPYASLLALAVDASAAVENVRTMKQMGWLGAFGFYESADFTVPGDAKQGSCELVRCWMAHHQGMILLSICNLLADSAMQNLFHAEPMVAATERLLHEKLARTAPVDRPEKPQVEESQAA